MDSVYDSYNCDPYKPIQDFLYNSYNFSDDQLKALRHETEMTQDMFSSILDRCLDIRLNAGRLFFRMIRDYPSFTNDRLDSCFKEQEK